MSACVKCNHLLTLAIAKGLKAVAEHCMDLPLCGQFGMSLLSKHLRWSRNVLPSAFEPVVDVVSLLIWASSLAWPIMPHVEDDLPGVSPVLSMIQSPLLPLM